MTGKVVNPNPAASLILIFPVAAAIIFLYEAWLYLLGLLLVIIAWRVWDNYQWQQWCGEINPLFNQLVKENQGCLTPLDLTLKANLTASSARRFLERKADEYGAYRRQLQDQSVVYYFISASTLGSIFDGSEFSQSDLTLSRLPASANSALVLDTPLSSTSPSLTNSSLPNPPLTDPIAALGTSTPTATSSPASPQNAIAHLAQIKEARLQETKPEVEFKPVINPLIINPITDAILSAPEDLLSTGLTSEESIEVLEPKAPAISPLAISPPSIANIPSGNESALDSSIDLSESLIQSDLAKRLDTTSSTIARRKTDPDFPLWSQSKDPDGIAWQYLDENKVFIPVRE
jgi:hypothetical protein